MGKFFEGVGVVFDVVVEFFFDVDLYGMFVVMFVVMVFDFFGWVVCVVKVL